MQLSTKQLLAEIASAELHRLAELKANLRLNNAHDTEVSGFLERQEANIVAALEDLHAP